MLMRRLYDALESAHYHVACSEEAAVYYGEAFSMWDRLVCWRNGFISGWNGFSQ